jgi:exonuclease III
LADEEFKKFAQRTDKEPLIVAGDFNCPSHLDWIEEVKHLHGGWVFEWPATKLLMDAGFSDAFREVHRNVTKSPGKNFKSD